MKREIEVIRPGDFEPQKHFYEKAQNCQLHPIVHHFFKLDIDRLMKRYLHLYPQVDPVVLKEILTYQPKYFFWGGADLFYVTTEQGNRKMVVLETNSCPSGQKSMAPTDDYDDHRGYRFLIENAFLPALKKKKRLPKGALAVIYDKNYMETSGYAGTLADVTGEDVYLIPHFNNEEQFISFDDGVMILRHEGKDIPIRGAFRYVTQRPWNRFPVVTKTFIFNSTLVCLSGGRNKLLANKAYEFFNSEIQSSGLRINMPETIKDVSKVEIPLWIERFGGKAVIKDPYSNAGQGVWTITSQKELDDFLEIETNYDQFIVQSLIGHYEWSSTSSDGRYFHVGTVPNKKGKIFISDLRVMASSSPQGFRPCAMYARRALAPLEAQVSGSSWDVLGTNLSIKTGENQWSSDTSRLLLMDRKDFNSLGIGIDDLAEAFIQTTLTIVAIDKMAKRLINSKGLFRQKLFKSLDNDEALIREIMI